jgi:DNA repair photolyase
MTEQEKEDAARDHHARRPPRPCGITIHPGIGCMLECSYCYIYDMGFNVDVKPYPLTGLQLIYALIVNKYFIPGLKGTYLAIGSVTEPFHPLLRERTLEYVEAIYRYLGNPTQFSTKFYIDSMTSKKLAEISRGKISPLVTIVTLGKHRELEPKAPSPEKRLETIRNLRDAGLKPFLFMRPIIPGLTEKEYREILELSMEYGAVGVVAGSLRVTRRILFKLKDSGIDLNNIIRRLGTTLEKMKPGRQYEVYTSDIKREIASRARKIGLVFYSSACMANLHTHGLLCWRMSSLRGFSEQGLMKPEMSEVQDLVRRLGGEFIRGEFRQGVLFIDVKCKNCDAKLISEVLRSRFLTCVKVYSERGLKLG